MIDTHKLEKHPDLLHNYKYKVGPWNKVFIITPIEIGDKGDFYVDRDIERRLITWVQTEDAWGLCKPRFWTSFEYRLPEVMYDPSR